MNLFKPEVLLGLTLALGLGLTSVSASAGSASGPTEVVKVGDLNFTSSADAQVAYQRIAAAAKRVCRQSRVASYPMSLRADRQCVKDTIDVAVRQANEPQLTAVHEGGGAQIASR